MNRGWNGSLRRGKRRWRSGAGEKSAAKVAAGAGEDPLPEELVLIPPPEGPPRKASR
jgi:hypothetical protein